jgi:polyhydroxyalkanoate synthesis regulator phasin
MLDTVRRYVEAGREALTSKKAEEMARDLVKQGQARRDQVEKVARDLRDWSRKSSERLRDTISREVKKQMSRAGVATKDEVESLKRRIRKLESGGKTTRKAGSRKTATARKRPAARKR